MSEDPPQGLGITKEDHFTLRRIAIDYEAGAAESGAIMTSMNTCFDIWTKVNLVTVKQLENGEVGKTPLYISHTRMN